MGLKTRLLASGKTEDNEFNISLLAFKMAVNEGLTVFNLVDGVVDEFHDESGTDEAEGSNDLYCSSSDLYKNATAPVAVSAGFSTTAVTEGDTSTAGNNPTYGTATNHTFTVPSGLSSINFFLWGGSGGTGDNNVYPSAGAGFTTGALAVTGSQSIYVGVAEAGMAGGQQGPPVTYGGSGLAHGGDSGEGPPSGSHGAGAGGGSGIASTNAQGPQWSTPQSPAIFAIGAGSGGGGNARFAGAGGGLTGIAYCGNYPNPQGATAGTAQVNAVPDGGNSGGGGGDQEQGGESGASSGDGSFMQGGKSTEGPGGSGQYDGGGGGGYYGGGAGYNGGGGGGSSYYGHPQVTSGSTEAGFIEGDSGSEGGAGGEPGGDDNPLYPQTSCAGNGVGVDNNHGRDGYVFLTGAVCGSTTSTTIVSTAFAANSIPTTSRIVVFQENVDTPTLNTDIIASISRDGGSNFTTATLSDSGYVTGSSGQRILTGQAAISGQPSGQSMRWKLALANNTVKIHGVSLQWS